MSPRHAATNYRALKPFLDAVNASPDHHRRFEVPDYMPLSLESLGYTDHRDLPVYGMMHFTTQNGDLMCAPDMTFSVDETAGAVYPLTFQNDFMGMYQEVFVYSESGKPTSWRPTLQTELDHFLWQWLRNIEEQGFYNSI